jgi:molybdate transport system substrate-binding protein
VPSVIKSVIALALAFAFPDPAFAQLKVIMSGGFATPYRSLAPEFEQSTGIVITTESGSSQGNGPETIGAQLRRGVRADVVIMSREGLDDLIADGMIVAGSDVDLAQAPLGIAVRAGVQKPNVETVNTFREVLLNAKSIAVGGSTSGIYLTTELLPRLKVQSAAIQITARGAQATALVAAGTADLALLPVSEILHVDGVDFAGAIPSELQFISVFSAAIVKGSPQVEASGALISFLTSARASAAIRDAGMEFPKRTVWQGVFNPEQAARGRNAFNANCRSCHNREIDLSGGAARALKGDVFFDRWREDQLQSLFDKMKGYMPPATAKLADAEYVDIISFLLEENALPAGARELKIAELPSIRVEGKEGSAPLSNLSIGVVVGCLTPGPAGVWNLVNATEPARTRRPESSSREEMQTAERAALGIQMFQLRSLNTLDGFTPEDFNGRKILAKGVIYVTTTPHFLNVLSIQPLQGACR